METAAAFLLPFFILVTLVQVAWWRQFGRAFRQLAQSAKNESSPPPPTSLIICARNEAENLKRHLPLFLAQNHPKFEVVVVNDHSDDKSLDILLDIQKKHYNLALVNLSDPVKTGKKVALSAGVEAARFENLVFSDADCYPASPNWLSQMSALLVDPHSLALGYGGYQQRAGWLNRWQRFETIYTAIQYFSFAVFGIPYMGVGRNLAYRKSLFLRVGGLRGHMHLLSGDDDLFVNQAASAPITTFTIAPTAFTWSIPAASLRGYYRQKQRHLSAGRHYRPEHQWLLGSLSISHLAHYGLGATVGWLQPQWWPFLTGMFLARMAVVFRVGRDASRLLKAPDLVGWFPLLDLFLLIYYLLLAPALFTGSRVVKQWK